MPATLQRLLEAPGLGLRLLNPADELPPASLTADVSWVHSSDLVDPTPFLSPGQVLLTTGAHFPTDDGDDDFYGHYVDRLHERGIAGIGFGTEVLRSGTPEALVAACRDRSLPVFEVPYRTPFIAVARLAADIVAEENHARESWALRAQRAISLAAIRPDGLSATLAELSTQLDCWVALFDAGASLDRVFPDRAVPGSTIDAVRADVTRLLRGGQRSSATVSAAGETVTLQTLGERGRLRGALAIGGAGQRDQASEQVVTSVIALASLALEQNHALDRARGHLRSGLLHMLLNGEVDLVAGIAEQMWGALPEAPVRLIIGEARPDSLDAAVEYLEVRAQDAGSPLFYALLDETVVLCVPAGADVDELVDSLDLRAGVSAPQGYDRMPEARREATLALEAARLDGGGGVRFESLAERGVLAFVSGDGARALGLGILRPLLDHDAAEGAHLVETLRVWLANNGQFEAASRTLGLHRHTLRARIAQAEQLLRRDLSSFEVRAELWAAIVAARADIRGPD
ncbi:PucR family transcriptional regulator [Parafrigoribacterium soli]|uniref:PucR family transcriptional regulator n=1 Tax=Parafrigoribacterium soli TaxID=3144663 RepID=UPI0032EC0B1B